MTWKQIQWECGENYEVSDGGLVRNKHTLHVLIPIRTGTKRSSGQRSKVCLCLEGKRKDYDVAHLVLSHFVGPRPSGMFALHGDDDTSNNALNNLTWGTPKENAKQTVQRNRNPNIKIPCGLAAEIKTRREAGEQGRALAREFGVSPQTICDIYKGRRIHL